MHVCTLVFPIQYMFNRTKQVLLGRKKRGFGAGKYNGFGGHVEPGETPISAGKRELKEECSLISDSLYYSGTLYFNFKNDNQKDHLVYVYTTYLWEGEVTESEEMAPVWFDVDKIPYEKMWQDDIIWLGKVLDKFKVQGTFVFDDDLLIDATVNLRK